MKHEKPQQPFQQPSQSYIGRTYSLPNGQGTITFTEKGYVKRPPSTPRPPAK